MQEDYEKEVSYAVNDDNDEQLIPKKSGSFLRSLAAAAQRKKEDGQDSIYDVSEEKVKILKLNNDSNTLGFACFLNKDLLDMDLSS